PILRPEILAATPTHGDHLLVYQTGDGHSTLLETLKKSGLECRIYGVRRDLTEEQVDGKLRFMPFSEPRFIADMASARAVIAGGGFTTMGEAVYLRKPLLAVPIQHQFEQVMNARYLEKLGYGQYAPHLDDPAIIERFLAAIPACQQNLASYQQDGNQRLYAELDAVIDRAAAGL
ncbi:MAG: teichoic acid biosynthesis protein, partial [Myxococcales bacterium]